MPNTATSGPKIPKSARLSRMISMTACTRFSGCAAECSRLALRCSTSAIARKSVCAAIPPTALEKAKLASPDQAPETDTMMPESEVAAPRMIPPASASPRRVRSPRTSASPVALIEARTTMAPASVKTNNRAGVGSAPIIGRRGRGVWNAVSCVPLSVLPFPRYRGARRMTDTGQALGRPRAMRCIPFGPDTGISVAQQLVDAGFRAGLCIDPFHDHRAVEVEVVLGGHGARDDNRIGRHFAHEDLAGFAVDDLGGFADVDAHAKDRAFAHDAAFDHFGAR